MIGNYRNPGRAWCKTAEAVLVHDWPQDSIGQAVPYGIYEVSANRGYVCVGDCFDTPRFAVEAIADLRISAIVDAHFSLIVDGQTALRRTRRGGAQALGLNVAQSSTISLKPASVEPVIGLVFGWFDI